MVGSKMIDVDHSGDPRAFLNYLSRRSASRWGVYGSYVLFDLFRGCPTTRHAHAGRHAAWTANQWHT
jgi:hypothetical protein